jgi:AraC-like DNA-binding protein
MPSSEASHAIALKVRSVASEIESNYARPWRAEDLAHIVRLSPSRLRHLFKSQTGEAPMRYLKLRRLQEAARLLRTTTLSVKEIMHRVGIADSSHFAHEFKRLFGVPPTEYRMMREQPSLTENQQTSAT